MTYSFATMLLKLAKNKAIKVDQKITLFKSFC